MNAVEIASPARSTTRVALPGIAMIAVTFGLARYGYGLLLPSMSNALHIGAGTAGIIASLTFVSYLAANIGVVRVVTTYGPRTAIACAVVAAVVGMTIVAAAPSTLFVAVGILVAGAAAGFAFPPYAELVDRRVPASRRSSTWAAISSGTGWGVAVAGPIAIAAGVAWRWAWIVFVAIAVVVGIVAVRCADARGSDASVVRRPQLSWTWFFCPKSRPLLVSALLVGAGSAVWWSFSVTMLRHSGVSATAASIIYAVCGVSGVLASASGLVFDRIGLRSGYLVSIGLLAAALTLLALEATSISAGVVAAVAFGFAYNAVVAGQGIWSSRVFGDHPAAGLAATNSALTVGTMAGPALAGVAISQVGYPATLISAAALVALALPFCPPTAARQGRLTAHRCRATPVRR